MRILWGMAACLLVASCAAEGNAETDRQAKTLADAISFPRQTSAAGFARAAFATPFGQSPGFTLLEMTELNAPEQADPLARLVIRIHHEGVDVTLGKVDPVTACYSMDFNYWGIIDTPDRITCPENAVPIPAPTMPDWKQPGSYDNALEAVLHVLPSDVDFSRAMSALERVGLVETGTVDPKTDAISRDPAIDVVVTPANDVGVAFKGSDGQCVLGSKVSGKIHVRRPDTAQTTCDARTALTIH